MTEVLGSNLFLQSVLAKLIIHNIQLQIINVPLEGAFCLCLLRIRQHPIDTHLSGLGQVFSSSHKTTLKQQLNG